MKGFKRWAKKGLALGAACAITATSLPMTSIQALAAGEKDAKAAEEGLILHYDFKSLKTGTIVEDLSGNGKSVRQGLR